MEIQFCIYLVIVIYCLEAGNTEKYAAVIALERAKCI